MVYEPPIAPEAFDVCPLLLAHPAADKWTPLAVSKPFFDRLDGEKELVMLEGCGHLPYEAPGVFQLFRGATIVRVAGWRCGDERGRAAKDAPPKRWQ